jgi:hypothetical protein
MYKLVAIGLLLVNVLIAQDNSCPDVFVLDQLGSVYTVHENVLSKTDVISGKKSTFSNPSFGNLSSIEVSNPNTVVLFYADAQLLVVLNRDLNYYIDPIDVDRLNLRFRVTRVTATAQRTIWMLDNSRQTLYLFDIEQNTMVSEVPLLSILKPDDEILSLDADLNNVYIELNKGVYICLDGLGVFLKKLTITQDVKWDNGIAYYVQDDFLKAYNPALLKEDIIGLFPSAHCDFDISKRQWHTINAKGEIKKGALK